MITKINQPKEEKQKKNRPKHEKIIEREMDNLFCERKQCIKCKKNANLQEENENQ